MFTRVSSNILMTNRASDICTSPTHSTVYAIIDNSIFEISLTTGKSQKIYTSNVEMNSIVCDEDDLLVNLEDDIIRLSAHSDKSLQWRSTPQIHLSEYPVPSEIRYSHYGFSIKARLSPIIPHEQREYSYVKDRTFYYYDGSGYKSYTLEGNISLPEQYVWWVHANGSSLFFCLSYTYWSSHIWKTYGDRAVLLWYGAPKESKHVAYSSISRSFYGLSYETDFSTWKSYCYVSGYQFEVPSLFTICSCVINREKMVNQVRPCLKEQVLAPEMERYRRNKDVENYKYPGITLVGLENRELYNNLPMP